MKIYLKEDYYVEIDEALFKEPNLTKHATGARAKILAPGEEFNPNDPKFESCMTIDEYKKRAEELSNEPAGTHADNSDPNHLRDNIFGWAISNYQSPKPRNIKIKLPTEETDYNPRKLPECVIYSQDDEVITYMLLQGKWKLNRYNRDFDSELNEMLELEEEDPKKKKNNTKVGVGDQEVANAVFNNSADTTSAPISESIEKHETLNPKLWGEDEELLPEVKEGIQKIVDQFVAELKDSEVELKVIDTILVGSNASYNYTKDSDLDVHIIADTSIIPCEYGLLPIVYNMAKSQFNNKYDITIHDVPVELYVEDMATSANSNGIYSLKSGWIKKPVAVDIPEVDISDVYPEWEERAKGLLEKEDTTIEDVDNFINDIYMLRKSSIMTDGEYAKGNLVFKELRNNGYLDKLKELKVKLTEKDMIVEKVEDEDALRQELYKLQQTYKLSDKSEENQKIGERIRELRAQLNIQPTKPDGRKDKRPPLVRSK